MQLETLVEIKFINSSFLAHPLFEIRQKVPVEQFEATVSQSTVPSQPSYV